MGVRGKGESGMDYELVDQYYEMDPKTEIILSGRELQNGMVVLIADPEKRRQVTGDLTNPSQELLKYNRWWTVSWVEKGATKGRAVVSFLGRQGDEPFDEAVLQEDIKVEWIVKVNSTAEYKRNRKLLALVKAWVDNVPEDRDRRLEYINDFAEAIQKFFD